MGEENKDTHDKDMGEILKSKEELRKSKERKLQRDRKLHKERRRNIPGSKPNFAQIATMHIKRNSKLQNQDLEKPSLRKTVLILKTKKIQDSHTDEEARGIAKKNAIFVGEDKESTNGEEQEKNPALGMKATDKLNKQTKKKIEKLKLSQLRKKRIVNKSPLRLTKSMEDQLSKNLNFCPKPSRVDEVDLNYSLDKFGSKLIWKEYHSPRVIDLPG